MEKQTECQIEIKKLRESTGMNRKEFCEVFDIPYNSYRVGKRNAQCPQLCTSTFSILYQDGKHG